MTDNRRVKMTKKLIKDAYLELLETHPSEKISVTEVCKTADVNRSTFYLYYESTAALRQDIEDEVMEQVPVLSDLPGGRAAEIPERFFSYIRENGRMFRILFLQSDNHAFKRRLICAVLEKYLQETGDGARPLEKYGYIFIVSGVIGLLDAWIEEDFPLGAKAFSEIVLKMALRAAGLKNETA